MFNTFRHSRCIVQVQKGVRLPFNCSVFQGQMCADFELKALECIEYYGAKQGITACKDWYDDYIECSTGNVSPLSLPHWQLDNLDNSGAKQSLRMRAMFKKRHIDNHLEYLQVSQLFGKMFPFWCFFFRARGPGMRRMRSLPNIIPIWSPGMMRSMLTLRCQCPVRRHPTPGIIVQCVENFILILFTGVAATWWEDFYKQK